MSVISSCAEALPPSDQTLATVEDISADLRQRLEVAEKNCSHYFELYKKYQLRWLEENQRADILEKYAPTDVDHYSPAQIQWDAPSPCLGREGHERKIVVPLVALSHRMSILASKKILPLAENNPFIWDCLDVQIGTGGDNGGQQLC
ncbi:hypothetical protein F4604DRAFT_1686134 [Suillus subluteus]|nr:hypothetical protein F4604DRAFT_1686134 [Suillus subluteus]